MIRLIFFDIDGTLIYHTHTYNSIRTNRYAYAIKKAWGIDVPVELPKYEGWIDRGLTWNIISKYGISRVMFIEKLPVFDSAMREYLEKAASESKLFLLIPEAKQLLELLKKFPDIHPAVLTGNVETTAWWKLANTGLKQYFAFGIFGDEADNKVDLAKHAIERANKFFQTTFIPSDIVLIGDTPFDIECGKSIGAKTVGVVTGRHNVTSDMFKKSGADLVIKSLVDPDLIHFLGIT